MSSPLSGDTPTTASSRIPSLDGLRAFSIALVFVGHAAGTQGAYPLTGTLGRLAIFGVTIFFVISGFLITTLLRTELERNSRISLRDFYRRRLLRIFPAFYAYLLVLAILTWTGVLHVTSREFFAASTYTVNFWRAGMGWVVAHFWSLSVEEQFYFLWPAILAFGSLLSARRTALMVLIAAPILRIIAHFTGITYTGQFPLVADTLAAGCLLALVRDSLHRKTWYAALLRSRMFFVIPVTAVLAACYPAGRSAPFVASLVTICVVVTVDCVVSGSVDFITQILNSGPIVWVGTLSYSLYIWQQLFLNRSSHSLFNSFPLNILCAVACAVISRYVIELPFLRLKNKQGRSPLASAPLLPVMSDTSA